MHGLLSLHYTSIWPYFALMGLFLLEGHLIQSVVPYYKRIAIEDAGDNSHYRQLDGLRGILSLGVFFTHALSHHQRWITGSWDAPPSNFYAQMATAPVAMFFLITGFLFWSKALSGSLGGLRTFFWHRIRRLAPAYLFALLLIGVVVALLTQFQLRTSPVNLCASILSYLCFTLFPAPALNGLADAPLVYANVFWSLRVEWMFYLALPFMAQFARSKRKQLVLLFIAIALQAGLPMLRQGLHLRPEMGTLGLGMLLYFDFFLVSYFSIGMATAFIRGHYRLQKAANHPLTTVLAICIVAVMLLAMPPKAGLMEGATLGIPFLLVVFGNSFFGLLTIRPLVFLGKISYSIYLLHGIVLFVANRIGAHVFNMATVSPAVFWLFSAATGMAVVVLASFSYRYCEAPFMKMSGSAAPEPRVQQRAEAV